MTAVKWLEVHIDTNHTGLEPVETMLSALGIDGVVIDDETEFEDFLENNGQYWDYVDEDLRQEMQGRSRITFYLEAGDEGFAKLGEVRIALEELKKTRDDCGTLLMTLDDLEDADWENNWKQYYKPMEIGDRLLVVPEWLREDPKVRAGLAAGRVALVLDPCHHPPVPDGAGEDHPRRRAGTGPGLRQRYPLHRGAEAGGGLRRGGGYRRQVPGRSL